MMVLVHDDTEEDTMDIIRTVTAALSRAWARQVRAHQVLDSSLRLWELDAVSTLRPVGAVTRRS